MHEPGAILHVTLLTFGLLFLAAMVSIGTRRVRLPLSVALVVLGLAIAAAARAIGPGEGLVAQAAAAVRDIRLTPDLILFLFLPTLLFESAYNLDVRQLWHNLAPIMVFAVPGLLLSTAIVGLALHLLVGMELTHAMLFGALISATDPVAVIALFKELGLPKRLVTLVEGESLFNDATAIVMFSIVLALVQGGVASAPAGAWQFVYVFLGGVAVGVAFGVVFSKIIEKVRNDRLVEITLTTVLAYLSFIVADHSLHVSGVMSTVGAGLTLGSYGRTKISAPVLEFMHQFWEYLAYVANALIFLLVGLYLPATFTAGDLATLAWPAGAAVLAAIASRAVVVYGLVPLLHLLRLSAPIDMGTRTVIFWGGLRGAIALALALSLIGRRDLPAGLPETILALTAAVVLFTLLVNALTMGRLVRAFGLDRESDAERLLRAESMAGVQREVEHDLALLRNEAVLPPKVVDGVLDAARRRAGDLGAALAGAAALTDEQALSYQRIQCLGVEKKHYLHLFAEGNLSETAVRVLSAEADARGDQVRRGRPADAAGAARPPGELLVRVLRLLPGAGRLAQRAQAARVAEMYETARGRFLAAREVLAEIGRKHEAGVFSGPRHEALAGDYRARRQRAQEDMDEITVQFPEYVGKVQEMLGTRFALNTEKHGYHRLLEQGLVTDTVHERLQSDVEERFHAIERRPVQALDLQPRALLGAVPLFSGLGSEELDAVARRLRGRSCLKGETLFREGEQGHTMYLIGRGVVRVFRGSGPARVPVATLTAGDFVGEMALLHPAPRTAAAETATVATLLELSKSDLDPILHAYPHVADTLERAYRDRLAALTGSAVAPSADGPAGTAPPR